jgi:type VI secretion system protein VasD
MKAGFMLRTAAMLCAALALCACVSVGSKPKVATVKLQIIAAGDVNPTADGRPSSLVLRIYQLKADTKFTGAEFFDLFEKQDEILAGELLASQELNLGPGETRELELEVSAEAKHIGVIAAYRDIRNAEWRAVADAPTKGLMNQVKKDAIMIRAQRAAVTVEIRE